VIGLISPNIYDYEPGPKPNEVSLLYHCVPVLTDDNERGPWDIKLTQAR